MAIEFNCPFCKALIRVPESAGGGKGKCPKCATRLTVPKVSTAKPVELPPALKPILEPARSPAPRDDRPREIENFFEPEYDPRTATASEPATAEPQSQPGEFPSELSGASSGETARISSGPAIRAKLPLGRKVARTLVRGLWAISIVVVATIGGGLGWYIWQQYQSEKLVGELVAEAADELDLPPVLVEKWSIKQPSEEVQSVLIELEKSPIPLKSSLMQIELRGSNRGVYVHLATGPSARFYRVDISSNKPLAKLLGQHAAEFEKQRMQAVEEAATAFATAYRKVIAKKADQASLTGFRNTLALPALVRGQGRQVVATHGPTIFPCVYEDREGALYFLLPPDVKSFEISGRPDDAGSAHFPARYKVKVAGLMKAPAKKDGEATGSPKSRKAKQGPVFKRSDQPEDMNDTADDAAMKKGE